MRNEYAVCAVAIKDCLNQRSTYLAYSYIVARWSCLRPRRFVLRRSAQAFTFSENPFQIFLFGVICYLLTCLFHLWYRTYAFWCAWTSSDRFWLLRMTNLRSIDPIHAVIKTFQFMGMTVSYAYKNDRTSRRGKEDQNGIQVISNMRFLNVGQHRQAQSRYSWLQSWR